VEWLAEGHDPRVANYVPQRLPRPLGLPSGGDRAGTGTGPDEELVAGNDLCGEKVEGR
jgi:hypothetical protein